MNLAALWRLPVLFCCENNRYAMGTALDRYESETDLALKAASYEMTSWSVDGMDVVAVEDASRRAVAEVRDGDRPAFLELRTYRFRAHSMYDPDLYRAKEEIEPYKQHDPIPALIDRLQGTGLLGEHDIAELEQSVAQEIEAAIAFAEVHVRAHRRSRAVRLLGGRGAMSVTPAQTITYRDAMREAIREALLADDRVFLHVPVGTVALMCGRPEARLSSRPQPRPRPRSFRLRFRLRPRWLRLCPRWLRLGPWSPFPSSP
jgi:hypothetical protein